MLIDVLYRVSGGDPGDYPGRIIQWRTAGYDWGPAEGNGRELLRNVEVSAEDVEEIEARRMMVVDGELRLVSRRRVGARTLIKARRRGWGPKKREGCIGCGWSPLKRRF